MAARRPNGRGLGRPGQVAEAEDELLRGGRQGLEVEVVGQVVNSLQSER